jgi:predicted GIY-YIG superfamily endonuclease
VFTINHEQPTINNQRSTTMAVYLLHFDRPYRHAKHYLGYTKDLAQRMSQHACGRGARLVEVITAAGIGFRLVRVWSDGTRKTERQVKRQKQSVRFCPVCSTRARELRRVER